MSPKETPRKIIFRNHLSPGDIVMLTAAVRDLHMCNPGKFITDVRTTADDLWANNPYLTPLNESDPDVSIINCQYPLIHKSNQAPFHFIHGFSQFLSEQLHVPVVPAAFRGDIHLSHEEKGWMSQVQEITKTDSPFWIVVAGGKMDFTIKWWSHERFQRVIDHFLGKIQFVQVGDLNHHHPALQNVIDLRGKTDIRQLVRLVHHSQGVLCPVTFLMHLAAAVPTKSGQLSSRACVVVAGGREPSHWEAYPEHRFLHTQGALSCCDSGGCWKARTVALGDGDEKDRRENLCVRVATSGLPKCMDMISDQNVIDAIQSYFDGGVIHFLREDQSPMASCDQTPSQSEHCNLKSNTKRGRARGTGIKLYSLRRSGTHALANWIADHYPGEVFYANDVRNRHSTEIDNFACDHLPVFNRREIIPVDFHSSPKADLALLVFEDANLWDSWEGEITSIDSKSELFKILVLRDPFNMIASRIEIVERRQSPFLRERMLKMDGLIPAFLTLWKDYAREFILCRDSSVSGVIAVNYNDWATNKQYRKGISAQLNRPHRDREKESVPGDGFGSSFDGGRFNQNASRMEILNRWTKYKMDKRFIEWTSDNELRELSLEIFGPIMT